MDINTVEECTKLSDEGKMTFPEAVARLDKAGIESYVTHMLVPNKIYCAGNEVYETPVNFTSELKVASQYNEEKLIQALRAVQSHKIDYQEFLKQIMNAGIVYYIVYIKGRKCVYFGRKGEQYTESFPSK